MAKIRIAILAAGCGQRMGGTKQTTVFEGETLLARAIRIAQESEVGEVNVVLGYQSEKMLALIPNNVSVTFNDSWTEGIASSIREAVKSAKSAECDGLLFTTCDQPFVDGPLLKSLAAAFDQTSKSVVASSYGTPGIPAIFSKEKFSDLLLLTGDEGAKQLIINNDAHLIPAPLAQYDIDTEDDLESCRLKNPKENDQWQKNTLATTAVTKRKTT